MNAFLIRDRINAAPQSPTCRCRPGAEKATALLPIFLRSPVSAMSPIPCLSKTTVEPLPHRILPDRHWGLALLLAMGIGIGGSHGADAIAQSPPPVPSTPPLTWETYTAVTALPVAEIEQLTLKFEFAGWEYREITVSLTKTPAGYRTDTGEPIEADRVEPLREALTQLRWSSVDKECTALTDAYPSFQLDLVFTDGERATIRSTSNCALNIPWNVTYQGNQYVQYTGELPLALYPLLAALPADPFQLQDSSLPTADQLDWVGELPLVASYLFLPAGSEFTVTEETLYRELLVTSDRFAPFAPFYDLPELELFCLLERSNPQCLTLEGELVLRSQTTQDFFPIAVRVEGPAIASLEVGPLYLDLGEYGAALDYYQQEWAQLQSSPDPDPAAVGSVLTQMGWAYHHLGDYAAALDAYQQALELYADQDHYRFPMAQTLNYQGQTYAALGQPAAAFTAYQQARERVGEWGEDAVRWQTFMNLAASAHQQGDYQTALSHYQTAFFTAPFWPHQGRKNAKAEADALTGAGQVYTALGQPAEATITHLNALIYRQSAGDRVGQVLALTDFGQALADWGEPELAIVFLKQALHQAAALQQDGPALPPRQQQRLTKALPGIYEALAARLRQTDRPDEAQLAETAAPWPAPITPIPLLPPERTIRDRTWGLGEELAALEVIPQGLRSETQIQRQAELWDAQTMLVNDLPAFINSPATQALIDQL